MTRLARLWSRTFAVLCIVVFACTALAVLAQGEAPPRFDVPSGAPGWFAVVTLGLNLAFAAAWKPLEKAGASRTWVFSGVTFLLALLAALFAPAATADQAITHFGAVLQAGAPGILLALRSTIQKNGAKRNAGAIAAGLR